MNITTAHNCNERVHSFISLSHWIGQKHSMRLDGTQGRLDDIGTYLFFNADFKTP